MEKRLGKFYRKLIVAMICFAVTLFLTVYKDMPKKEKTKNDETQAVTENAKDRELAERRQLEENTDYTSMKVIRKAELTAAPEDADYLTGSIVIFECNNGDVYLNGDGVAYFPIEKIALEGNENEAWLLLPVAHRDTKQNGFPTIYDIAYYPDLYQTQYDYQRSSVYEYFEQGITNGEMVEGLILTDWNESQVTLQKIRFRYIFETYTIVQKDGKRVYRMADGTPVQSYLDLPHSRLIEQEGSGKLITLTVKETAK